MWNIAFYFYFLLSTVAVGQNIEVDYYFGDGALRMPEKKCRNQVLRLKCLLKCGDSHVCIMGKCYCIQSVSEINENKLPTQKQIKDEELFLDYDEYKEITSIIPHLSQTEYGLRPALRHHIAHFCPNLEEARKCIRRCMRLGKPAFCGKDHICYCGHDYGTPNKDESVDINGMYAEFHDLYEKYFGPKDGK